MHLRKVLIAVFCLALAVPGFAGAQRPHESGYKVTGGGQIIASANTPGPGDTVGFVAQQMGEADQDTGVAEARGQMQFVGRDGAGPPTQKFHGSVTCIVDLGDNVARFGGHVREGSEGDGPFFTVDVTDNGQGAQADDDLILVRDTDEPCEEQEDEDNRQFLVLARGNVKIHNDQ